MQVLDNVSSHDIDLVRRVAVVALSDIAKADIRCTTDARKILAKRFTEDHGDGEAVRIAAAIALESVGALCGEMLVAALCGEGSRPFRARVGKLTIKIYEDADREAAERLASTMTTNLVSTFSGGDQKTRKRVVGTLLRFHDLSLLCRLHRESIERLLISACVEESRLVRTLARRAANLLGVPIGASVSDGMQRLVDSSSIIQSMCKNIHGDRLDADVLEKVGDAIAALSHLRHHISALDCEEASGDFAASSRIIMSCSPQIDSDVSTPPRTPTPGDVEGDLNDENPETESPESRSPSSDYY